MTPQEVLKDFQRKAQHGGVQFYLLDDSSGTENFAGQIAAGIGNHILLGGSKHSRIKFEYFKPLVLVTNRFAKNISEDELTNLHSQSHRKVTIVKDRLSKGKLHPDTPICVIGGSRSIPKKLKECFANPILFLGNNPYDHSVLASELIADGSGIYITCSNVKRDKTKTGSVN